MNVNFQRRLCLHGAILIFIGFFSGFMIGAVAVGEMGGELDDWKLAHMEAPVKGSERLMRSMALRGKQGALDDLDWTDKLNSPGKHN